MCSAPTFPGTVKHVSAPETISRGSAFWAVAKQPRMIGLLLIFLTAAGVCGALGTWQLDRARERGELAAAQEQAEIEAQGATQLGELLAPQQTFPGNLIGRTVTVTGHYEPEQVLVEGRVHEDRLGYLVVTAFRVDDDGTAGSSWAELSGPPLVTVVRGWVPTVEAAAALQPLPTSQVRIVGYLQSAEGGGRDTVADGVVEAISPAQLMQHWGGPTYSGYFVLADQDVPLDPDLALMPRPTIPGGGLNVQNLAYAIQWWVFGGFALFLWIRVVRDTVKDEMAELAEAAEAAVATSP